LTRANAGFYEAFETLDVDRMRAVWRETDYVKCIHPGWELLEGFDAVVESWAAIFRNTSVMRFRLTEVRAEVRGDFGWVQCTENLLGHDSRGDAIGQMVATNLFERVDDRWLLVHHHASIFTPRVRQRDMRRN
jgi:ketosteroid isomerase-like protein